MLHFLVIFSLVSLCFSFTVFKNSFIPKSRYQLNAKDSAEFALLFDCDGVIVETEELHRVAYNSAFEKFGLKNPDGSAVVWDVPYYDILQNTVGGGKPKMKHYFNNDAGGWPTVSMSGYQTPTTDEDKSKLVDDLQAIYIL